jgi:hypothetical protein
MRFNPMPAILGVRMWGACTGRHSYIVSHLGECGYCASWKDAASIKPSSANVIGEGLATFDAAHRACEAHAREMLLK